MTRATRVVTIRDFLIFQTKLILDGLKDVVLVSVSTAAVVLDIVSGAGRRPRLFYSVLKISERFDLWLDLNGATSGLDRSGDGLFGASRAGSNTFLGQLERSCVEATCRVARRRGPDLL